LLYFKRAFEVAGPKRKVDSDDEEEFDVDDETKRKDDSGDDDEEEEEEEFDVNDEDSILDQEVEPIDGHMFDEVQRKVLFIRGMAGEFAQPRVFRVRLDLDHVVGARLQTMRVEYGAMEGDRDVPAVFVLETSPATQ
jgi:hypothetical protein